MGGAGVLGNMGVGRLGTNSGLVLRPTWYSLGVSALALDRFNREKEGAGSIPAQRIGASVGGVSFVGAMKPLESD